MTRWAVFAPIPLIACIERTSSVCIALAISFVLVIYFDGSSLIRGRDIIETQNTFLGLNLFLEILIFLPLIS